MSFQLCESHSNTYPIEADKELSRETELRLFLFYLLQKGYFVEPIINTKRIVNDFNQKKGEIYDDYKKRRGYKF
jgi:hypothetical protein